ncbi:putative transcription factor interactor and regulator CCHC(Zn) family [Helianthus annuus]|nr:uncharacterized protein LOC110934157 isoform X2 [Helianthus annuus]KAJ0928645.1 putative transcription factor interactor and regulator CCHC(Zn) family [Helianthus annuus]
MIMIALKNVRNHNQIIGPTILNLRTLYINTDTLTTLDTLIHTRNTFRYPNTSPETEKTTGENHGLAGDRRRIRCRNQFHHVSMSSSRQFSNSSKKSKTSSQKKMMAFMANQIARIVPKIVTEIQASNTPNSSVDSKVAKPKPVTFNYKHFASCNPKPFTGKDGVTAMLEWFDSIEVTFINSECPEELKTRSATGVFQARALEWWTNERNIRSNEEAYTLPWEEVKQLMMEEFCPPHEQQKLEEEFWALKQIGDDNLAYTTCFKQLSFIVPHLVSTTDRMIRKYIHGLPSGMRDTIEAAKLDNIEAVYRLAASLNNNRVRDKQVATSTKIANQITTNTEAQASGSEGRKRKFQHPETVNKVRACYKCGDTTHLHPQCPLRQRTQDDNEVTNG